MTWLRKAAPFILTVLAGAGVITTAVLAAKATPKAIEKKEEVEKEKGEPLTTTEKVKAMAPSYASAIGSGVVTIASIAGMTVLSHKDHAELTGAIIGGNQIINHMSRKYTVLKDKVMEKEPEIVKEVEEKSLNEQWEEYAKSRANKTQAWCNSECLSDCSGESWGTKRLFGIEYGNGLADENGHEIIFFEATPGDVLAAFYNLNGMFKIDGFKYVNDLFGFLNLPKTELGEKLMWDGSVLYDEWDTDMISFYTEDLTMEDDVPEPATCTMIYFHIPPLAEGYADWLNEEAR